MSRYYSIHPEYTQISKEDKELRDRIVAIMERYNGQVGYATWDGNSEDGISEEDFEDVADDIMKEFGIGSCVDLNSKL